LLLLFGIEHIGGFRDGW